MRTFFLCCKTLFSMRDPFSFYFKPTFVRPDEQYKVKYGFLGGNSESVTRSNSTQFTIQLPIHMHFNSANNYSFLACIDPTRTIHVTHSHAFPIWLTIQLVFCLHRSDHTILFSFIGLLCT